jgi:hypothetical protein
MTTYKTGNPIGSTAVKDLYDNAENLDFAVNDMTSTVWEDRLGVLRKTWLGVESEGDTDPPWTAYTPQIRASVGQLEQTLIRFAGFRVRGDIIDIRIIFDIVNNGTGNDALYIGVPVTIGDHSILQSSKMDFNASNIYHNSFAFAPASADEVFLVGAEGEYNVTDGATFIIIGSYSSIKIVSK